MDNGLVTRYGSLFLNSFRVGFWHLRTYVLMRSESRTHRIPAQQSSGSRQARFFGFLPHQLSVRRGSVFASD